VLRNPRVWLMVLVYGTMTFLNTNQVWFPSLLKNVGVASVKDVGWILSAVWVVVAIVVLLACRNSDRVGERRWHIAISGVVAGAAYLALPLAAGSVWATALLVMLGAAGGYVVFTVFWTIPPAYLEGRGAAMGIAMVSAIGQLGGLSGPAVVGWAYKSSGSLYLGLGIAGAVILAGTAVAVFAIPHARLRRPGAATA
jgi:MFS family permease